MRSLSERGYSGEICSGCSVREIFDFIEEHGVEIESNEELQELADVLMLLWNDTRMIVNRGLNRVNC